MSFKTICFSFNFSMKKFWNLCLRGFKALLFLKVLNKLMHTEGPENHALWWPMLIYLEDTLIKFIKFQELLVKMASDLVTLSIKNTKLWRNVFSSPEVIGKPVHNSAVCDTTLIWQFLRLMMNYMKLGLYWIIMENCRFFMYLCMHTDR